MKNLMELPAGKRMGIYICKAILDLKDAGFFMFFALLGTLKAFIGINV